jgi:glycosyltransferase involved in cell wall biosynthesis
MKVLHVIPAVSSRYGGPSRVVVSLCEALAEQGVSVEIATTDADGDERYTKDQWTSPVPLHLFESNLNSRTRSSTQLAAWLNENIAKYDLVHTHSVWNAPVHAACTAARMAKVPLVYRPCGMLSNYTWSRGRAKKLAYWWLRERANVRGAAAIHCTSDEERDEAIRCGARSEQTVVIPNAVDEEGFRHPPSRNQLRETWASRIGSRMVLLFLSRLHPKKGLTDFLLPAMVSLKDRVHLMIVGGEDDHAHGYRDELLRAIDKHGLQDHCDLVGAIPPAERWAYFDAADVCVLPSHSENFGIVVAEAMVRACPVLITKGVQIHPHVEFAGGGLVVEPTVEAVQSGLRQLLNDSTARSVLAVAGQIYAKAMFSWRRTATEVQTLYTNLLNRSRR